MEQIKKRKARSDRIHIIYRLTNLKTGDFYIGMTVCAGLSPARALEERTKRHVQRALCQGKNWKLCQSIREHGPTSFKGEVLHRVRGKAEAHKLERLTTKELGATLNTA